MSCIKKKKKKKQIIHGAVSDQSDQYLATVKSLPPQTS